jgi:hypothetical protein
MTPEADYKAVLIKQPCIDSHTYTEIDGTNVLRQEKPTGFQIHPWTWKPFAASVLLICFSKAQVVRAMDNFCVIMLCLYMAAFVFAFI